MYLILIIPAARRTLLRLRFATDNGAVSHEARI